MLRPTSVSAVNTAEGKGCRHHYDYDYDYDYDYYYNTLRLPILNGMGVA